MVDVYFLGRSRVADLSQKTKKNKRTHMDSVWIASFLLRRTFRNATGAKAHAWQLVNIVRTKNAKVNICPVVTIRKTCFRLLLSHPYRHRTSANDQNLKKKPRKISTDKHDIHDVNFTIKYDPNETCDNEPRCEIFTSRR